MSSAAGSEISGFTLLGGIPVGKDIAPSIIFLIFYVIIAPVLAVKLMLSRTRFLGTIRVLIFSLARIGAFVIRTIMAVKNKDGKNVTKSYYIAELILFMAGLVLIIEPSFTTAVDLFKPVVAQTSANKRFLQLARIVMIVPLVLLIVAATDMTSSDPNLSQDKTFRIASYCILLAATAIGALGSAIVGGHSTTHYGFTVKSRYIAICINMVCAGLCAYRLAQTLASASAPANNIVVFYVISCLLEAVVVSFFAVFNFRVLFLEPRMAALQSQSDLYADEDPNGLKQ